MEIHLIVVEIFHKCQLHSGAEGEVLGSPPVISDNAILRAIRVSDKTERAKNRSCI